VMARQKRGSEIWEEVGEDTLTFVKHVATKREGERWIKTEGNPGRFYQVKPVTNLYGVLVQKVRSLVVTRDVSAQEAKPKEAADALAE